MWWFCGFVPGRSIAAQLAPLVIPQLVLSLSLAATKRPPLSLAGPAKRPAKRPATLNWRSSALIERLGVKTSRWRPCSRPNGVPMLMGSTAGAGVGDGGVVREGEKQAAVLLSGYGSSWSCLALLLSSCGAAVARRFVHVRAGTNQSLIMPVVGADQVESMESDLP